MTFLHQGKKILIKGDPSLTKARVSLKNLIKTWEDFDQGFLVECRSMEGETTSSEDNENEIEEVLTIEELVSVVLKKYEDVFTWPEKLSHGEA